MTGIENIEMKEEMKDEEFISDGDGVVVDVGGRDVDGGRGRSSGG
jgi:hypothetical protein